MDEKRKYHILIFILLVILMLIIYAFVDRFYLNSVTTEIDDDENEVENDKSVKKDPIIERAEPYFSKIEFNNITLRTYANSIIRGESCTDRECQLNAIYRHVVENYNYISDPEGDELIQTPQETMKIKGGDCEDLSILLASLLDNVGIKTYLVLTDNHAYCLAYDIDIDNLWNYIEKSLIDQIEEYAGENIRQTYTQAFSLNSFNNWYYGGDGSDISEYFEYLNISYSIESDEPLNIYIVPSQEDFDLFNEGKTFTHYPSCERENILSLEDSCDYLDSYGGIILTNNNWQRATVSIELEFYYRPSFYDLFSDATITSYEIDNVDCVVLEPTLGEYGYAGYDATLYGEKIAFDPVTLEYTYLEYSYLDPDTFADKYLE